jgi:hypothetical protein
MESVWNPYGTPMESLWNIRRATPEQQAGNAPLTGWPGARSDAKRLYAGVGVPPESLVVVTSCASGAGRVKTTKRRVVRQT